MPDPNEFMGEFLKALSKSNEELPFSFFTNIINIYGSMESFVISFGQSYNSFDKPVFRKVAVAGMSPVTAKMLMLILQKTISEVEKKNGKTIDIPKGFKMTSPTEPIHEQ